MVISEIAAATLIAVCGLKKSYRIVLRGERLIRRQMYVSATVRANGSALTRRRNKPSPIVEGYDSFPRFFVRRVFRAGLGIAMKWEGRAKTAAQRATDARMRARRAGKLVVSRAEDMRSVAKGRATAVRERVSREYAKRAASRTDKPRDSGDGRGSDDGSTGGGGGGSSRLASGNPRSIVPPNGKQDRSMKMVHTRFR